MIRSSPVSVAGPRRWEAARHEVSELAENHTSVPTRIFRASTRTSRARDSSVRMSAYLRGDYDRALEVARQNKLAEKGYPIAVYNLRETERRSLGVS